MPPADAVGVVAAVDIAADDDTDGLAEAEAPAVDVPPDGLAPDDGESEHAARIGAAPTTAPPASADFRTARRVKNELDI
jgi:hypothetical protein